MNLNQKLNQEYQVAVRVALLETECIAQMDKLEMNHQRFMQHTQVTQEWDENQLLVRIHEVMALITDQQSVKKQLNMQLKYSKDQENGKIQLVKQKQYLLSQSQL